MKITGYWYPVNSSARYDAQLHTDGTHYRLKIEENDDLQGVIASITVSDRVGNIPRKMTLEDQSLFETQNNDEVDRLLQESAHKDGFLHILETRWQKNFITNSISVNLKTCLMPLPCLRVKL